MKNDIFISLSESAKIFNWLGKKILIEKKKDWHADCFEFEVQIPEPLIRNQLAFARVAVQNDGVGLTFHDYPDDVVADVQLRRKIDTIYLASSTETRGTIFKIARERGCKTSEQVGEIGEGLCVHFIEPADCPRGCGYFL